MFFGLHRICQILTEYPNLPDEDPRAKEFRQKASEQLLPGNPDDTYPPGLSDGKRLADLRPVLVTWLGHLPPPDKQLKIAAKFTHIAEKRGARVSDFAWWSMGMKGHLHLRLLVERKNGTRMHIVLSWKRRKYLKGEQKKSPALASSRSWGFDHEALGGWRFDIEGDVYPDVRKSFREWLEEETLPTLPNGSPYSTFAEA